MLTSMLDSVKFRQAPDVAQFSTENNMEASYKLFLTYKESWTWWLITIAISNNYSIDSLFYKLSVR